MHVIPLADQFQAYVQRLTGLVLEWQAWPGSVLPGYLSQRYDPYPVIVAGQTWLAILLRQPDPPPPLQLRKQLEQLVTRLEPRPAGGCLVAEHLSPYLRTRLVELAQPFVVPGRQLFWPAIGGAETVQRPQRLRPRPVEILGPVAQQLLIVLLLKRLLPPVTISFAAQSLGCSAASVSQAVRALEGSELVQTQLQGRDRIIALRDAPERTWQRAQPLLRAPVRQRVRMPEAMRPQEVVIRAGESALAEQTSLAAPAEPVYARASRGWPKQAKDLPGIPMPDIGTCVIELWRYPPDSTARQGLVDPLSLYLSLRDSKDERVQLALQQLMEQMTW